MSDGADQLGTRQEVLAVLAAWSSSRLSSIFRVRYLFACFEIYKNLKHGLVQSLSNKRDKARLASLRFSATTILGLDLFTLRCLMF